MRDLGLVDAYAFAVSKGFAGTRDEFATLMASYGTVAQAAAASAQTAQTAASTATTKASEASASATSASGSASTASTKASEASASASTASTAASTATAKAGEASQSATSAASSASTASTKASEASASATSAQEARTGAETAQAGAESAAQTAQAGADAVGLLREQIYNSYPNVEAEEGPIVSISDGADGIPVKSLVVGIEPVQAGSGDPSPDNVRPITGWTGATVTRTGKNLLPNEAVSGFAAGITWVKNADGSITINGTATGNYNIPVYGASSSDLKPFPCSGKPITVSGCPSGGGTSSFRLGGYLYKDGVYTGWTLIDDGRTKTVSGADFNQIYFVLFVYSGYTYNNVTFYPMVEYGSTHTTYEPYQGETYPITFPTEAGTVYGGSLDVTKGVLTVTKGLIASYAGEELPGAWISDRDVYAEGATPTTGAQVVYELATSITYQLTPTEVITTLLGSNAIWADTGGVEEMAYRADTKLYIDEVFDDYQDDLADYASALAALG